jgi:hypothetical protein
MCNKDRVSPELESRLRAKGYKGGLSFTELWRGVPLKIYTDDTPFYLIIERAVRKLPVMSIGYKDANYEFYGSEVFNHESPAEAVGLLLEWQDER